MIEVPNIPHLNQYLGPMLIHEPAMVELLSYVNRVDFAQHMARARDNGRVGGDAAYQITAGGVAVFNVEGPLSKYGSSLSQAPSMVELRHSVRQAANDPNVSAILFRIDSPGGTYVGTGDLGREIRAATSAKPVHAYIEDMGASGAYWIASQASRITANHGALVGSIGTYTTITDSSQAAGKLGLVVKVIASGELKGAGTPGTKFTEAQEQDAHRVVSEINEVFLQAVADGRGVDVEQIRELATGQVHEAARALDLGLIDDIGTFDDALAMVAGERQATHRIQNERTTVMSSKSRGRARIQDQDEREEQTQDEEEEMTEEDERDEQAEGDEEERAEDEDKNPETRARSKGKPATLSQLKTAIPDGDSDFYLSCLENGMSIRAAERQWTDTLRARLESRDEEVQSLRKRPGNRALTANGKAASSTTATADPIEQWNTRIEELVGKGKTKPQAIRTLVTQEPELHKAYIDAYSARLR